MSGPDWRDLPALSTLRAFEATARLGGYSAAARSLNVTPAAIAQQVRKLERETGARLVRREGRGLVVTDAGRQLAAPLRDAFALMAEGVNAVRAAEAARPIRVSTTHFFVDAVILPNLSEFWKRHPGIEVIFAPEGNLAPVDFDRFDLVIRGVLNGGDWPGMDSRVLLTSEIIAAGAPALLERHGGDIAAMPWLRDRSIEAGGQLDLIASTGLEREAIRIVDPGDSRYELEAAVMGYGLSHGPEIIARKALAEGSLVRIDADFGLTGCYYALNRPGELPAQVAVFLAWLTEVSARMGVVPPGPGEGR